MTLRVFVGALLALVVFFSVGAVVAILATGDDSSDEPTIATGPATTR